MNKFPTRYLMAAARNLNPILFDVSLRDGIQGANPKDFETHTKLKWINTIWKTHSPPKMEIGSFVSPKVLPIMADTHTVLEYVNSRVKTDDMRTEPYVLVPNKTGLLSAIHHGARNLSFITSVSDAFQVKNTRRDLQYKKAELNEMMRIIADDVKPRNTKLYVSCINACPLAGEIDNDFILNEISSSYTPIELIDEICLSDTMGTLKCADFEYIVDGLIRLGLDNTRISIHLHINSENAIEAKQILFACFKRGINRFDVSDIMEGGCSVSMAASQLKPNMTYEFFYLTLQEYATNISN